MKKILTIFTALLLMFTMVFSLVACGRDDGGDNGGDNGGGDNPSFEQRPDKDKPNYGEGRTLNIYLWKPAGTPDMTAVLTEWKARVKGKFGFDVKFTFDTQDQYKQNLALKMSASSDSFDLVFDAPWMYLSEWSQEGYYNDLTKYFNNPNFPGLEKAFTESYLDKNLFKGTDGKKGVYGVPLTESFGGAASCVIYREDWREAAVAAGVSSLSSGINTTADLTAYLDWVKVNKPGVVPFGANNNGHYSPYSLIEANTGLPSNSQWVSAGIKQGIMLNSTNTASAYVDPETNKVVDVQVQFEKPGAHLNYPAPFNTIDTKWQQSMTETRSWMTKGYLSSDIQSEADAVSQFSAGKYGAIYNDVSNLIAYQNAITKVDPKAKLEIFVADKNLREKVPQAMGSNFQAWNFVSIPTFSKNADLAILFMDWLFESRENHDLFQYGIEGVNWKKVDGAGGVYEYEVTAQHTPYAFPPYLLSWNPTYLRSPIGMTKKAAEFLAYATAPTTYSEYLYSEFRFDPTPVKNEMANPDLASYTTDHVPYHIGVIGEPITGWSSVQNKWYTNTKLQEDILKIKQELIKQLQAHIDGLDK